MEQAARLAEILEHFALVALPIQMAAKVASSPEVGGSNRDGIFGVLFLGLKGAF